MTSGGPATIATTPRRAAVWRTATRRSVHGALVAALATLCGCLSPVDGGRGLPPLYEGYQEGNRSRFALRPLALFEREGDRSELSVLWPLYRRDQNGASRRQWLLPFWYSSVRVHESGAEDHDEVFFPLVYYGSDPQEGSYFLLFPVGGTLKGLLGQDRIDFALFPAYARARDRERVSTHVLWPLINWIDGPQHDGWRLFPFYGRYTASTPDGRKKYDRRFYLWPLFHAQENNLDTERPTRARWFFPFFGKIESEKQVRYSVLWPLYTFVRQGDSTTVALPALPIIWSRGPELEQTDIWPLFGVKRRRSASGTSLRQYFLWPLQRYEHQAIGDRITESYWFLPIFWHHHHLDTRSGTETATTRLWPLYSNHRRADGRRETALLDLLPFDGAPRFEELYARLWRLYRHVEEPATGERRWDLLWGLASGARSPDARSFSILGGLLGREERAGVRRWRVFYIPF